MLTPSKQHYLNVIRWEQANHSIMFALVPVLVYLTTHEYYVTATEIQFSRRLPDKVVKCPCHEPRFRCLLLGSASVAQIVHEVVVTVQGNRWFLRRSEIICYKKEDQPRHIITRTLRDFWKIKLRTKICRE